MADLQLKARFTKIINDRRRISTDGTCTYCGLPNSWCIYNVQDMTCECEFCAGQRIWKSLTTPKLDLEDFARIG